jgi:uncharacterized protein YlxW (UPF0749 family)
VPVVFALAGLLFATSAEIARGIDLRPGERGDFTELIRAEQTRVEAENRRIAALRRAIDAQTGVAAGRDDRVGQAADRIAELAKAVGLGAVRGPALIVTLDDAPRSARDKLPEGTSPDDLVVHQQDLQGVINALWAGGAEAMQVMDQRVIATSAPRCVGNVLVLQGRQYPPPYIVTAIGPVAAMQRALDESPAVAAYREYVALVGVQYSVQRADAATIPAYEGSLDLLHARAAT